MAEIDFEELPKQFNLESRRKKTALPSNGDNLLAPLASTFERCFNFVILNSNQDRVITTCLNDSQAAARGADIQAAQLLVDQRIEVVITPKISFGALKILQKAGVKIFLGVVGSLQKNINLYRKRRLVETIIKEEICIMEV
jgi:predicted Fe-Mo cluster-binding NifX family protein